jgi:hypothetical protein
VAELQRHTLERVSPYLVRLGLVDDVSGDDIMAIFERLDPWVEGRPFWLFEVDISRLGQVSQEARRSAAERLGKTPGYAMALHGGSLAQRAIATLVLKLSELFSGSRDVSHAFIKDAAGARAWLLQEGRRRATKARVDFDG